jgi:hypothetical protein
MQKYPAITHVNIVAEKITAQMSDGREVSIPLAWFPRLLSASPAQRSKLEISPGGYGIHWPEVDEDVSIKAFLE